jgi:FkbM family methyltransferase
MKIDDIEIDDSRVLHVGPLNVVLQTRYGLMCVNRYSPIGRSLCHYGEHAYLEMSFCAQFIEPGATVIDVGAHQGTHALFFANCVGPDGVVLSFEPQRVMFQNLCANLALNSLQNVHAFQEGVDAEDGWLRIKDYDYAKRGHFSAMRFDPNNSGEPVRVRKLDSVLAFSDAMPRIDFLKIDVEGMEQQVVAGARDLISRDRPVIYCEYHGDPKPNARARAVQAELETLGYRLFQHKPPGYNPDNFFGLQQDRFNGGRDHNAVCVHKEAVSQYEAFLRDLPSVSSTAL